MDSITKSAQIIDHQVNITFIMLNARQWDKGAFVTWQDFLQHSSIRIWKQTSHGRRTEHQGELVLKINTDVLAKLKEDDLQITAISETLIAAAP